MSKTVYFCFLIICISASTCKKEPPVASSNFASPQGELTLLWKSYLYDANGAFSINPILNNNKDILMSARYNSIGESEIIKLYDGRTGVQKWEWNDYLRHEEYFLNSSHAISDDVLILSAHNATYALNMITGQTVWKNYIDTMYGSHLVYTHDGYVYKGFQGEEGRFKSYIFRTPVHALNWELVCTYTDSTNQFDRMYVKGMSFAQNSKGETLIIYPLACGGAASSFAVICCFNVTKGKYEWIKNYDDKYLAFWSGGVMVSGQSVVLYAVRGVVFYILGLDLSDGSFLWDRTLPSDGVGLYQYKGNVVSTVNGRSPVTCYRPETGQIIWQQNFTPETISKFNFETGDANVFKNYFLSTQCNNLLILNLDNGNVVYNKQVAQNRGCLQYGVAINEQERTFYVQDRTYVNCFKLPEEVKY